jgi:hypothetical protein
MPFEIFALPAIACLVWGFVSGLRAGKERLPDA